VRAGSGVSALVIAIVLLVAAGSGVGRAAPAPAAAAAPAAEADPATRARKRAREKSAHEAFLARRYQEAIDILTALHAEFGDPLHLRNIGRCHQMMEQPDPAIANFKEYLARGQNLTQKDLAEIQKYIRDMEDLKRRQAAATSPVPGAPAAPAASAPPASAPPPPSSPPAAAPPASAPPPPPSGASAPLASAPPPPPAAAAPAGSGGPGGPPGSGAPPAAPPGPGGGAWGPGPPPPGPSPSPAPVPAATARSEGMSRGASLGLGATLAAVGAGGIVVGSMFGLKAKSRNDESQEHCVDNVCTVEGKEARDDALSKARLSTIFFVGGAILLAGGAYFIVRAPAPRPAASVALGAARLYDVGVDAAPAAGGGSFLVRGRF
jgi:hypothetical protein